MARLRFLRSEGLQWLRFVYFIVTLITCAQAMFKSSFGTGAAALGAAALCYFSVATLVGTLRARKEQRTSRKDLSVIGAVAFVLCAAGLTLMLWSGWRITIYDLVIPGFGWAMVGIVIAVVSTTKKDALPRYDARASGGLSPEEFEKIIHAYSAALMNTAGRLVMDASELPHPKERIKGALAFALRHTSEGNMRSQLRSAYLSLADWQSGIGDASAAFTGAIIEANVTGDDVRLGAERIARAGAPFQKWLPIIEAERKQLLAELERLDQPS